MSKEKSEIRELDPQILYDIIDGRKLPEGIGEEMFLASYLAAAGGSTLRALMVEMAELFNSMDVDETFLVMMGYAMGQEKLEDSEIDLHTMNNDGNIKLH